MISHRQADILDALKQKEEVELVFSQGIEMDESGARNYASNFKQNLSSYYVKYDCVDSGPLNFPISSVIVEKSRANHKVISYFLTRFLGSIWQYKYEMVGQARFSADESKMYIKVKKKQPA